MGLHPSIDSHTSLASIDPVVAEQIYRVKAFHQQLSSEAKQHPPEKAPEPHTYTSHDIIQAPKLQVTLSPKALEKTRKNSLRRVKNSNEVLRQRSTRARRGAEPSDHASIGKEGRNFTVANVGTGGKLYLRYAIREHTQMLTLMHFLRTGRQRANHNIDCIPRSCLPLKLPTPVCTTIYQRMTTIVMIQEVACGRILKFPTSQQEANWKDQPSV